MPIHMLADSPEDARAYRIKARHTSLRQLTNQMAEREGIVPTPDDQPIPMDASNRLRLAAAHLTRCNASRPGGRCSHLTAVLTPIRNRAARLTASFDRNDHAFSLRSIE